LAAAYHYAEAGVALAGDWHEAGVQLAEALGCPTRIGTTVTSIRPITADGVRPGWPVLVNKFNPNMRPARQLLGCARHYHIFPMDWYTGRVVTVREDWLLARADKPCKPAAEVLEAVRV